MNKNNYTIKDRVYDLEIYFEPIYLLSEIIKDFGDYSSDIVNGAEKMQIMAEILSEKCCDYKRFLVDLIPEIRKELDEI